jgi:hypothetical protein
LTDRLTDAGPARAKVRQHMVELGLLRGLD